MSWNKNKKIEANKAIEFIALFASFISFRYIGLANFVVDFEVDPVVDLEVLLVLHLHFRHLLLN